MKVVTVICLILVFVNGFSSSQFSPVFRSHPPPPVGNGVETRSSDTVSLNNFTQKLDHFNSSDENTWNQRYYVNTGFFNATSNNVVFMQMGGESPIDESWMIYGSWITSATKYGALLFQLEHRFYGESQPLSDLSTENLRFLTSEQALADTANFIQTMNKQYSLASDVKWIVFGGSYSGSLAAWMKLKYPDLVYGAVASSAPLLAKLDFNEYYQVVVDDMASINQTCVDSLQTAMSQVEAILNDPGANETVTSILNLCSSIEGLASDHANVQTFYNRLGLVFSSIAQTNGLRKPSVEDLCNVLTNENNGKEIVRLSEVIKMVDGTSCVTNSYMTNVQFWRRADVNTGDRQWIYQTCTEFGWFQPTVREDRVFGAGCPLDYYTTMCSDIFGLEFNKEFLADKISVTNSNYGGKDINVTNVIFVQGSFDPWHPVGLTETENENIHVFYVEGTAHVADMYDTEGEPEQLTQTKAEISKLIGAWLGFNEA